MPLRWLFMPDSVLPVLATSVSEAARDVRLIEYRKTPEAMLALEMMAEGQSYKEVEAATGITFSTLAALRTRHSDALEVRKRELAAGGFEMAEKARMILNRKFDMLADDDDQIRKMTAKDAALAYAVLQDKALQAAEGNKVVVEHQKGRPSLEDARAYLDSLKAAAREKLRQTSIPIQADDAEA